MNKFWEEDLPVGYYDKILTKGLKNKKGIQANWHNLTFVEVAEFFDNTKKHLDYACGPGTFIGNYLNCDSIGIDVSDEQIDYAKKKYGDNFYTLEEFKVIPNSKKKFEIITILGLFEFLKDEEIDILINQLYGMLSEGGTLIFTTPNTQSSMKYLQKIISLFGPVDYRQQHINTQSVDKFYKMFKKSKFKIVEINKIHNIGIFFSFFSLSIGKKTNNFIKKIEILNNGFLIMGVLRK